MVGKKHITIVVGHARKGTFCEAWGEAYQRGAREAGHEARLYVLSKMLFDPVLYEGFSKVQPLEPDLKAAHDAILMADHLVIVFPLWLGDMPAILKGFLERVLQPEMVEPARTGKFVKLLKGKSARIVVTMGMPGVIYRWYFGAHAVKLLKRNILRFLGVGAISTSILGGVEAVGEARRKAWLADAEAFGRSAN